MIRAAEIDDHRVDQESAGAGEGGGGTFDCESDVRRELSWIGNDCEGKHGAGDDDEIEEYLLTGEKLEDDEQTERKAESHRPTRLPEEDSVEQIHRERWEEHPTQVEVGESIELQKCRGKAVDESADERH